jgi:tripartite-type tricarboxylate transporter receptor subunit TctC
VLCLLQMWDMTTSCNDLQTHTRNTGGKELAEAPLPDVPSFTELGYEKAVSQFMFGLVGPARMPATLANRIATDVAAVMSDKAFQEKNVDPFGFKVATETPEAFRAFLMKDKEAQRLRVEAANVKLD